MENIAKVPKENILKIFDMKGSKFDRKVLKAEEKGKNIDPSKKILKDLDFIELEKKLNIEEYHKSYLVK